MWKGTISVSKAGCTFASAASASSVCLAESRLFLVPTLSFFHCSPSFLMISSISAWDTFPFFSKARRKIMPQHLFSFSAVCKGCLHASAHLRHNVYHIGKACGDGILHLLADEARRQGGLHLLWKSLQQMRPASPEPEKKKLHFSASSTILTGICFAWQTAAILALTASQSVAPMTKHISSTSSA